MNFPIAHRVWMRRIVGFIGLILAAGCQSSKLPGVPSTQPAAPGLTPWVANADVLALCCPPQGWTPQPLDTGGRHTQQTWLSPSTNTAYGVAHIKLPLPIAIIGIDRVLQGIVDDMAQKQMSATVNNRQTDPNLPGLRVEIKGGEYTLRANLINGGWEAWFIFASTDNTEAIDQKELDLALLARDHTVISRQSGK
jgi:hypothetical protein